MGKIFSNKAIQIFKEFWLEIYDTTTNPDTGFLSLYFKVDGKLYKKNSAGIESSLSSELVDDTSPQLGADLDTNSKRVLESQGADIDSTNNLSLVGAGNIQGNIYVISGITTVNLIDNTQWKNGSTICLKFNNICTIKHGLTTSSTFKKIILAKKADYQTAAGDVIVLKLINNEWCEQNTTGSAGHIIQENGVNAATAEPVLNIKTNGLIDVLNDTPGVSTNLEMRFFASMDVVPTNRINGDVFAYDSVLDKMIPESPVPFMDIVKSPEVNLIVDSMGELNTYVIADYSIIGIRVVGDGTLTAGNLSIGITLNGSEIGKLKLTTTIDTFLPLRKRWFHKTNDTILYISGLTDGSLSLEFLMIKGIFSEFVSITNSVKEIATTPVYYTDNSLKIIKYLYVLDPTKFYEERYEYTNSIVSKMEVKDDASDYWVQKTNLFDINELMQLPTIITITDWTII